MKVKSSIFSMFLSIILTFSTFSTFSEDINLELLEQQIEEETVKTYSNGGSRRRTVTEEVYNPLYPVEVGEWGLYLPGQRLSFYATQWARDSTKEYTDYDSVNVYLYKAYAVPEGIVDVEIKDNYLNIYARELGTTTVTAWVYSDEGHTMSNTVKITTKEALPDFIKKVEPISINLEETKTYDTNLFTYPIVIETRDVIIHDMVSSNENVEVNFSKHEFSLFGKQEGESVVTVTLLDQLRDVFADTSFNVSVTDHVYGN